MTRWFHRILLTASILAAATPSGAEPLALGQFKDWAAFRATESGTTVCYIGSKPKQAKGDYTLRGDAYVLVSIRPTDGPNGVVTVEAGYPYKAESKVTVDIDGERQFELFTRNREEDGKGDAWADDDAMDQALIEAMKAGRQMVIKGRSSRGTLTTDSYSLLGFTRAYQEIDGKCEP